jgi:hypothetical protein
MYNHVSHKKWPSVLTVMMVRCTNTQEYYEHGNEFVSFMKGGGTSLAKRLQASQELCLTLLVGMCVYAVHASRLWTQKKGSNIFCKCEK